MNTNVWTDGGAETQRESLKQEARRWHLRHQPPARMEDWLAKRRELLAAIRDAAGTFPERGPLDVREHGTIRLEGYRIVKLTYRSRPGLRVTANLYVPDGKGPFPGVLGVHGHWNQGKIAARVAARGHVLAREGFVTLTVDAIGSGERGTKPGAFEYHGSQIGGTLMGIGETLLGMQIHDNMRGIDLLQSLPYVDGARIGVTGASGGGNQTMWITAVDDRVKASVPVVSVGSFESYVTERNCICEVLPGGLTFMEEWGALALAAPNAVLILNAMRDTNPTFYVKEMVRSFNAAREVYRLYGAQDRLAYQAIDLPHGYWPEMRRHMLGWFKRWLKGEGAGWPCEAPEPPELPEKDLMCFPTKRPKDVGTILEYATARGREMKTGILAGADRIDARAKARDLARLTGAAALGGERRGGVAVSEEDGLECRRFTVEGASGAMIPCVLLRAPGRKAGRVTLVADRKGKANAMKRDEVKALLKRGAAVCLADLRNTGETAWMVEGIVDDHDSARTVLWLGRTMIGEWAEDLSAVRAVLVKDHPETQVEVLAFDEPAIAALTAAALGVEFSRVTAVGLLHSYVVEGAKPAQGMSMLVPGILKWGDVSLMAALADCPVTVPSAVRPSGAALTTRELAAWRREVAGLRRRTR